MKENLNWAVLGTGVIANEMAQALQKMGKNLYAVANRTHEKAIAFANKYDVQKVYDGIDDMFEDEDVDIIYITSPHNTHYAFMEKALQHGKHLLVEKSITLNSRELDSMIALANQKQLIMAEAMTIWHMPIYKKLWDIVKSNQLGKVQMITVNFGSFKEYDMNNRFFNMNLAGGAMLDIGVYALSIVRSFMDETPTDIVSQWKASPTGSDEQATILLKNKQDQMATVALSMHSKQPKRAMISCEKGYIEIMEYPRADKAVLVDAETGEKTEVELYFGSGQDKGIYFTYNGQAFRVLREDEQGIRDLINYLIQNGFSYRYTIVDQSVMADTALEWIASDEKYDYYLSSRRSDHIVLCFENGTVLSLREALDKGVVDVSGLIRNGLDVVPLPRDQEKLTPEEGN